jgi:hypothetical protein
VLDKQLADVVAFANTPKADGGLGLLLLVDVVYNHTSPDAAWLKDHPEACYNLNNTPHLKPGFVLDQGMALNVCVCLSVCVSVCVNACLLTVRVSRLAAPFVQVPHHFSNIFYSTKASIQGHR